MDFNSRKYTVLEIKTILRKIFEEETDNHKHEVKFLPMTLVEYYKSDIFKKNLALFNMQEKLYRIKQPFTDIGFQDSIMKVIVLFIRNKKLNNPITLPDLIEALYHELKHEYQIVSRRNSKRLDLSVFEYDISVFVKNNELEHYKNHHDEYPNELDANLYGVNKAIEYLERNGMLSDDVREYLEKVRCLYLYDYANYDLQPFLEKFNEIIQNNTEIDKEDLPSWFTIFYNEDRTFKTVGEILAGSNIKGVEARFLHIFFSSKNFLRNIDFKSLSRGDQQVIIFSLQTILDIELERLRTIKKYLDKGYIDLQQYKTSYTRISNKLAYYTRIVDEFNKIRKSIDKGISDESELSEKSK